MDRSRRAGTAAVVSARSSGAQTHEDATLPLVVPAAQRQSAIRAERCSLVNPGVAAGVSGAASDRDARAKRLEDAVELLAATLLLALEVDALGGQ